MNDIFVISAASGTGKTSLVTALRESVPNLAVSISHTTRVPRPGEIDGKHYHFVEHSTFETMINHREFIEHAEVFGNLYGTARSEIIRLFQQNQDVILEIDWQGARQVRDSFPSAITIFILPPSLEELRRRLDSRGQDSAAVIERRLAGAYEEMSHLDEFDYIVINENFSNALADLSAIIRALRLLRTHCVTRYAEHRSEPRMASDPPPAVAKRSGAE